jgi:hypothetical protein
LADDIGCYTEGLCAKGEEKEDGLECNHFTR